MTNSQRGALELNLIAMKDQSGDFIQLFPILKPS